MDGVLMFPDVGFTGGFKLEIRTGEAWPTLPPPMGAADGQASSMYVCSAQWAVFWESPNFDEGDDSLWVAPVGPNYQWNLDNLHTIGRPHGTNHWGDRIRGVSFTPVGPTGSNENRTIINGDGTISVGAAAEERAGNEGHRPGRQVVAGERRDPTLVVRREPIAELGAGIPSLR